MDIDASTWQALGVLLSVLGVLLSVLVWRRRGPAAGIRGVAWSLLPAAAGLTGVLKLLWQIGTNLVDWAVRLVFSPVVWVGVATAGLSLVLFAVSAAMRARSGGAARTGSPGPALPGERSSRAAQGPSRSADKQSGSKPGKAGRPEPTISDDDMEDIEAILRKRGIS